jgi:hypothetical protein
MFPTNVIQKIQKNLCLITFLEIRVLCILDNEGYKHTLRMCDTYCSFYGKSGYANTLQCYVLRTFSVLLAIKPVLYCTNTSLHNDHNYIDHQIARRQILEAYILVFLRQNFCGFGSVRKPISLRLVFHVHPKIQLFHPEWMPQTHQTGIRRHDTHDAVVTGHENQAFDSCWQMMLGTLCDVFPPDITGPTLYDPCVVWSVHTKMVRLPETNMCKEPMNLSPQDMAVDIKTAVLLPDFETRLSVISLN